MPHPQAIEQAFAQAVERYAELGVDVGGISLDALGSTDVGNAAGDALDSTAEEAGECDFGVKLATRDIRSNGIDVRGFPRTNNQQVGVGQTPARLPAVQLSFVANRVTSTPRATSASVKRLVTSSHGP